MSNIGHASAITIDSSPPGPLSVHTRKAIPMDISPGARLLLRVLLDFVNLEHADRTGEWQAFPGTAELLRITGYKSESSIRNVVKELQAKGLVEVLRRPREGTDWDTNIYRINRSALTSPKICTTPPPKIDPIRSKNKAATEEAMINADARADETHTPMTTSPEMSSPESASESERSKIIAPASRAQQMAEWKAQREASRIQAPCTECGALEVVYPEQAPTFVCAACRVEQRRAAEGEAVRRKRADFHGAA